MASARALKARIETARDEAGRLVSHGALALLVRALAARAEFQAERLVEDAERMLRACEAAGSLPAERPAPRAPRAPRAPTPKPACFGNGSPNTAARRAEQLERKRATTARYSCPKGSSNGGSAQQGGGKKGGKKKGKGKK